MGRDGERKGVEARMEKGGAGGPEADRSRQGRPELVGMQTAEPGDGHNHSGKLSQGTLGVAMQALPRPSPNLT